MPVQSGIMTPGTYTSINTNTTRVGLPQNIHKVLFVTDDNKVLTTPTAIYDQASADNLLVENSIAGRMVKAAIKTNRLIDAYVMPMTLEVAPPISET